jgi:hypothetical protein
VSFERSGPAEKAADLGRQSGRGHRLVEEGVHDEQIGGAAFDDLEALAAAAGGGHLEARALQEHPAGVHDIGIVIDDEDSFHGRQSIPKPRAGEHLPSRPTRKSGIASAAVSGYD